MNKFKLNNTLICFIPIIIILPIIFQITSNFHVGGVNIFIDFIISALNPNINSELINIAIVRIYETFLNSLFSWIISINFGIFLGILSSNIFYKFIRLPIFIRIFIRFFLNIIRSIHELIWCLFLIQIFGINQLIGILAISIPFTAINAKVISEQLENINSRSIDFMIQLSGKNLSSLITLIWIPILKTIQNFGLYRFECSLRSTAILGLFGMGGIGTSIFLSFQSLNFREMWAYLWAFALLVVICKELIKRVKNKIKQNFNILFFGITIILFLYIFYFLLNINTIDFKFLSNIFYEESLFVNAIIPEGYFVSVFETIILSLSTTAIAISLPPFLMLISQNKYFIYFLRLIAFWLRIIPPPIILLILLMFNNPSISLAALTLGLHNAAITFKLLNDNLNQTDNFNYQAMKACGASSRTSWLFGLFAKQCKSYLSYCAYRSDIIVRETAIVGVLGSIGLGWKFQEALSSFAWNEVYGILFAYSSIAMIGELINGKIKSKLT